MSSVCRSPFCEFSSWASISFFVSHSRGVVTRIEIDLNEFFALRSKLALFFSRHFRSDGNKYFLSLPNVFNWQIEKWLWTHDREREREIRKKRAREKVQTICSNSLFFFYPFVREEREKEKSLWSEAGFIFFVYTLHSFPYSLLCVEGKMGRGCKKERREKKGNLLGRR